MRVAVAGSGPSGIAAAHVLLERGFDVDMLDGGREAEAESRDFAQRLLARLRAGQAPSAEDRRFLIRGGGECGRGQALRQAFDLLLRRRIAPAALEKRVLGSTFAFASPADDPPLEGAWLPRSLAVGGLANVWGTACYPLRADDYADWPVTPAELAPWFARATALFGVWGEADALAEAYPLLGEMAALGGREARDGGSPLEDVLAHWRANQAALTGHGLIGGRARLAVAPPDAAERACLRCGLCLHGCPAGAMWHAAPALERLKRHGRFRHLPGRTVRRFIEQAPGLVLQTEAEAEGGGESYDALFLAAGAVASLGIVAGSLEAGGTAVPVRENDMFVLPFRARLAGARGRVDPPRFALHEAVLAIAPGVIAPRPAHLQLYQVTGPLLGPLAPLAAALPEAAGVQLRRWLSRYVIGFLYLHSDDSRVMTVNIRRWRDGRPVLNVNAPAVPAGRDAAERAVALLRRAARATALRPVGGLMRAGPPGFSGHIGGTLPMRDRPGPLQCDHDGRLFGQPRVMVVDAAGFPAMPAQNPTLTVAANAMRIADRFAARQGRASR